MAAGDLKRGVISGAVGQLALKLPTSGGDVDNIKTIKTTLNLVKYPNGSVTLEANRYELFTFHKDGSVFAHACISQEFTGIHTTKKSQRVKLTKGERA